jgi:hypothetical protein
MRAMSTSTDPREHFRVFPVAVIPKSSYVVPRNPKDTASLFQATASLVERHYVKKLKSLASWGKGGLNDALPSRRNYKRTRRKNKKGFQPREPPEPPQFAIIDDSQDAIQTLQYQFRGSTCGMATQW